MKLLLILPSTGANSIPTGSLVLFKKYIKKLPSNEIAFFSVAGYKNEIHDWMHGYTCYFSNSMLFHPIILKFFRKTIFNRVHFFYERVIYTYFTIKKIKRVIDKEKIEKIWTMGCGETSSIVKKIHQQTKVPFHLSIMDDLLEKDFYTRKMYSKNLREDISYINNNYKTCDVISPYMRDYYVKKYNICLDAINIWAGFVDCKHIIAPVIMNRIKKIAHIGSIPRDMYQEHWALWNAIEILNESRSDENKISLDYYTPSFNYYRLGMDKQNNINRYDLIPQDIFINTLKEYDLLYVNMWFDSNWEVHNKTSFPSKTISYIESAVPILAHGPKDSTIIQFINKYNGGLPVTSIEPKIIAKAISDFEENLSLRKQVSKNLVYLAKNDLNFNKNWPNLKKLLYKI